MSPIALDAELVAKLTGNGGEVPLIDPDGKPIGYYLSPERFEVMQSALYDQAFAELSDEEATRILANPKRHTMEEVLKLLEGK